MKTKNPSPFWCVAMIIKKCVPITTKFQHELNAKWCGGRKNIFGRKLNDLGWVCHERWAKSQSQSPITLTRYKESRSPKQINATCQQKMIFRSLCVRACVVFVFPFSCRVFASFRPHSRFVALHSMWFWFGASKLKNFFRRVHSYFFCTRTHWTVVWCILVVATDTFSYLLSLCSFQFWPFLCDTHTAFWVLASWMEMAQQHHRHHHLWLDEVKIVYTGRTNFLGKIKRNSNQIVTHTFCWRWMS